MNLPKNTTLEEDLKPLMELLWVLPTTAEQHAYLVAFWEKYPHFHP